MTKHYCKICDKDIISNGFTHHMKMHDKNFKFIEYVKENLELFAKYKLCDGCGVKVVPKRRTYSTCSMDCRSIAQAIHHKGRNIWAEMSEETRKEASRKISENTSLHNQGRNIWAEMSSETRREAKRKLSIAGKRYSGENNGMYGKTHTMEAIEKIFKNRGTTNPEQQVKDFLDLNGIEYTFQFYKKHPETAKAFIYDFHLIGTKIIIEVDGDYWHGGPSLIKYCAQINENRIRDEVKTDLAKLLGFKLFRFWESEIKTNPEKLNVILEEIKKENN